jgi:hypothetical protein
MLGRIHPLPRARRVVVALAASLSAFCVTGLAASSATAAVSGGNCPGPTNGQVLPSVRNAQTFTAQATGHLLQGQIEIDKTASGGAFTMTLYATDGSGTPTNTELGSTVIGDAAVPSGISNLTGVFSSPPSVVAGQVYALGVSRSPNTGWSIRERGGAGDACPGTEFISGSANGSWFNDGGTDLDYVFTTLVEPLAPQPQPQPEPEPQPTPKADGTLTIDANKGKVEKGRKVTLSGQLDVAANESCEPGRQIQIQRRLKSEDDSKFATFETVTTDATGNYSTKEKVKKTYFYRAVVAENESCDDETSNSQKVRVQKKKAAQEA